MRDNSRERKVPQSLWKSRLCALLGGGEDSPTSDIAEQLLKVGASAAAAKSLMIQMERLLVVPLRSSTVRFWEGLSSWLGVGAELTPWAAASMLIIPAEYQAVKGSLKGTCRAGF